jgi:PAS domain-containing protein
MSNKTAFVLGIPGDVIPREIVSLGRFALLGSRPYRRPMAEAHTQRNLILILARDLASRLATPVFVVDHEGTLVYFNEAAEPVLGRTYAETGELRAGEWATEWTPTDDEGRLIPLEDLPLGVAFREGRASHLPFRIVGGDGVARAIEATAFPLLIREGEIVGAIAVFWERPAEETAKR